MKNEADPSAKNDVTVVFPSRVWIFTWSSEAAVTYVRVLFRVSERHLYILVGPLHKKRN